MKKIEIMGCGYIGLPTAITFTLAGFEVCGFDVKQEVVAPAEQRKNPHCRAGLAGCADAGACHGSAALYDEAGAGRCVYHRGADAV